MNMGKVLPVLISGAVKMWARFCRIVYEKSLRNIGQGFVSVNA